MIEANDGRQGNVADKLRRYITHLASGVGPGARHQVGVVPGVLDMVS